MQSVSEARARILSVARPTATEELPLGECLGRVPAEFRLTAPIDVPPFANSAMDGFAVRVVDLPATLRLSGEATAGAAELPEVRPGATVRIMTGAPLPPGADAVVPLEEVEESDGTVRVPLVEAGLHVRAVGHDTRAGEVFDLPRAPLTASALGVLATLGIGRVAVRRRPRVALLSTGDELVPPGQPLRSGQIYDANSVALAAAIADAGGEALPADAVPDDAERTRSALLRGAASAELVVVSGGVSVGNRDFVRTGIEELGRLELWRIAVQPGKPLAFGDLDGTPVIGLPGNPVSALVTCELFVRPMLRAMVGLSGDGRERIRVVAAQEIAKDPSRQAYLRVRLSRSGDEWRAEPAGGQALSQMRPLLDANGLLIVPVGERAARAGATYDAIVFGGIG